MRSQRLALCSRPNPFDLLNQVPQVNSIADVSGFVNELLMHALVVSRHEPDISAAYVRLSVGIISRSSPSSKRSLEVEQVTRTEAQVGVRDYYPVVVIRMAHERLILFSKRLIIYPQAGVGRKE